MPQALAVMAIPTVVSQLITLVYNVTDTWYIGRTNNPYMVGAASMVATVFLILQGLTNLFGNGGGNQTVSLLGKGDTEEARKTASLSLVMAAGAALLFALVCFLFMRPLLYFLGASEQTYGYARQYLLVVVIAGALPTVLSNTMSFLVRNTGYSREAAVGLGMGGILNMALDPLFMFVLLPRGCEVLGAAIATLLSNCAALTYFVIIYRKLSGKSVLELPKRIERVRPESLRSIFIVGVPACLSLLFYDMTNMMLNRLSAAHGDRALAAMGIVLKVERLPLNIGIGIGLGMIPLVAYNYAAGNKKRMFSVFRAARAAGLFVAILSVISYYTFAPAIFRAFIRDAETVAIGTKILRARCFATPFMVLSFHMVYLMQALKEGGWAFKLAFIRQLCLNIPILLLLDHLFGMDGLVWSQVMADIINVAVSYLVYWNVKKRL